ncbi:MAG: hypothetical protein IPI61_09125 [Syntrophaceae bacterium]|nr:hypothetical protein [Syntrophaceae bacterium]
MPISRPGGMSCVASGAAGGVPGAPSCRRSVRFGPTPVIFPRIMPCSPVISPWDMPGIDRFCVAALTQYWVRGFFGFGSAADAGDAKQANIATAATAQVVFLRRLMVHTSPGNFCCRGQEGSKA